MRDLSELENTLQRVARLYPEAVVKFMDKTIRLVRSKARDKTPKGTKKYYYYKGYKTFISDAKRMRNRWNVGRVKKDGDTYVVILRNRAPHAHLLEDGHKTQNGGFVPGIKMLTVSLEELDDEMPDHVSEMLDEIFERL